MLMRIKTVAEARSGTLFIAGEKCCSALPFQSACCAVCSCGIKQLDASLLQMPSVHSHSPRPSAHTSRQSATQGCKLHPCIMQPQLHVTAHTAQLASTLVSSSGQEGCFHCVLLAFASSHPKCSRRCNPAAAKPHRPAARRLVCS